jgi:hypothetical protein
MATAEAGRGMAVIADSFLTSKTCPLWPEWSAMAVSIGTVEDIEDRNLPPPACTREAGKGRRPTANVCRSPGWWWPFSNPAVILARRFRRVTGWMLAAKLATPT